MRKETKLIKEILKLHYPNNKFKFRYKVATNYVDSSDMLIVICDRWQDIDNIIYIINQNVFGIKVFKKGEIASIFIDDIESKIFSVKENKWIEAGLMEFIEVCNE